MDTTIYLVISLPSPFGDVTKAAVCASREECEREIAGMTINVLGGGKPDIFCSDDPKYAVLAYPSAAVMKWYGAMAGARNKSGKPDSQQNSQQIRNKPG